MADYQPDAQLYMDYCLLEQKVDYLGLTVEEAALDLPIERRQAALDEYNKWHWICESKKISTKKEDL